MMPKVFLIAFVAHVGLSSILLHLMQLINSVYTNIHFFFVSLAMIVRFLTKRFIGEYDQNIGR